ncbi:uncharacterized protein BJ171DRAFT_425260 [Polychytrium aggregatum]|uniref:uncharacterized protein n=2 Tax=Polychytrium aggregatum TaxID=110093 RepID=UPI0022FE2DA5|nr:uncharacterized protein BJ171DRAFT_425260 [Polychytrium aggregatum]KAI9203500.1 hypothetical protein BJ171DRAFT_425260 [Polychytrium aggregatum]
MIAISRRFGDQAVDDHSWLAALTDQADIVASLFLARFLLLKIDRRAECEDEPDDAYDDSDSDDAASERSTPSSQNGRILSLLEKAAGAGHPMAHLSLAKCYLTGHGADQDHTKAIGLLHECANRGIAQASASLAQCYENGEGVKQDLTTAIEWYTKAASQGDKSARLGATFLGGWVSFIGHGVEQSDVDAFSHWQEQLANEGHSDSQFWTGCCYFYYRGVPRSYSKAFYWFSKAADQDNSYGQWMVGACYGNGWGVTKDETKAAEWYRKSAEQGNQHGQVRLGNCFRNGLGVAKDIDTAVLWYHRSADQGWWEAKHELKRLGKYQE